MNENLVLEPIYFQKLSGTNFAFDQRKKSDKASSLPMSSSSEPRQAGRLLWDILWHNGTVENSLLPEG